MELFGKNWIFPTKSFLENATVVEMTSWILLSLWKLPNCCGNDATDICSSRSSSTYKPLADRPNKVPRAYLSWCKWIDWSYVPFSHSIGDGVSIGQVFMCHDVFSKSSSILGWWSRTSQWKAGPRDDSHKVFFGISVYVMLLMWMRNSFVTHEADDPLQKRRSSPACSLRPSLWSSIRMKATQGLLPNEDSCHRWHPVKWCDPNIDIIQCSFWGKEAMMWGENIYAGNIWEWMWGFIIQHFLTKKPLCSRNTITGQDKAYGSWPIITSLNETFFLFIFDYTLRGLENFKI